VDVVAALVEDVTLVTAANEHDEEVDSLEELDEFEAEYLMDEAVDEEEEDDESMPLSHDSNEACCVTVKLASLFIFINCLA
jgi:hypothetical protein